MIGVFVCHCGINIGGVIDIDGLVKEIEDATGDDVLVYQNLFVCSQAGQDLIKEKIDEEGLDRVVVASCSPKHHGDIFSKCVGEKMNSYLWEMVNIREQCSWVHRDDPEKATGKAFALIMGGIEKARELLEIGKTSVPLTKDVLVIGGGIAGMHTSLELADKDFKVYLVEKKPNIGGNMVRL
ncbi:MAG: FAD-binding protein, partial [Halobacteriota archaeon]|nr:FAD-binding protein [Halobacteriota archaeon]